MANKPNQGRAGIFRPWDGTLTGPQKGEPAPVKERNQTWNSVQKRQSGRMFTADEVRDIVANAIAAIKEGKEVPGIPDAPAKKEEDKEKEFLLGGK